MKHYFLISLFFLKILFFSLVFGQQAVLQSAEPSSQEKEVSNPWEDSLFLDPRPDGSSTNREGENFEAKFFRMLVILGLLIGFMILAAWALKKMMKTRVDQLNTSNSIKVLETRALSPRSTLYLIEIEGQTFLIGESPTMVSRLASLSTASHEEFSNRPVV